MLKGKVLVAQGGGPTAVINQSLVGAVLESRKFPGVEHVYGSLHGISGIVNEDFLDLTGDHRQSGTGRPDPVFGPGVDPRQTRCQILPGNFQGPQGP